MAINAIIGFKMRQQQETTRSRPAANKEAYCCNRPKNKCSYYSLTKNILSSAETEARSISQELTKLLALKSNCFISGFFCLYGEYDKFAYHRYHRKKLRHMQMLPQVSP